MAVINFKWLGENPISSGQVEEIITSYTQPIQEDLEELEGRVDDLEEDLEGKQDKLTAGNGISISDDNIISCTLDNNIFILVEELPEVGQPNKIYVIQAETGETGNLYVEYAWIENQWEEIGKFSEEIDLSEYAKIEYVDSEISDVVEQIGDVADDVSTLSIEVGDVAQSLAYITNDFNDKIESLSGSVDGVEESIDELEASVDYVSGVVDTKQDTLVSGESIKTINNISILGSGDITISGDITREEVEELISEATDPIITDVETLSGDVDEVAQTLAYITNDFNDKIESLSGSVDGFEESIDELEAAVSYISGAVDDKADTSYVDSGLSSKQDTLVSGTNIKTINNQSLLGSGNISITGGGGGSSFIELTQEEYDELVDIDPDAVYVITDSNPVDIDEYLTKEEAEETYATIEYVDTELETKTDKISTTANTSSRIFPKWNEQGVITGNYQTVYESTLNINGSGNGGIIRTSSSSFGNIYAPTAVGTKDQVLLSNGSGAPVWANYKFQFLSQSAYDDLGTYDNNTIYFIVSED